MRFCFVTQSCCPKFRYVESSTYVCRWIEYVTLLRARTKTAASAIFVALWAQKSLETDVTVFRFRFPVPRSSRGGHQDQAKLCNGTRKFFLPRLPFPRISFVGHYVGHIPFHRLCYTSYTRTYVTVEAIPWKRYRGSQPTINYLLLPLSLLFSSLFYCFLSLFFRAPFSLPDGRLN